ncbi:hypothetical protein [Salibacterium qingdaonense]|uniref:Sulfotransferase domain-containing protein n=1 Tax=Salibacterium qingdaonense TaxID=266892 RepID=A0A1I4PWA5_9BACI|nr:hypothetical protein [Salibacterium qingdaonense]SFM32089.1 hypothetical protein SAMN04488054_1332 [Salibacterium qingdaonense]
MRKKVFVHIGFHKTATSFLQRCIYPNLSSVRYLKYGKLKQELYDLRLKKLSDERIQEIREKVDSFYKRKPLLISYEGLSGSPFSQKRSKSNIRVLEDIRRVFPEEEYDVHIIVGIREQVNLLTSLYVQYVHQGGVNKPERHLQNLERQGILDHYHYEYYLDKVRELFGDNHYYVLIYEHFKNDMDARMLDLLQYMGEEEIPPYENEQINRSYGTLQMAIGRRANHLFKTKLHPKGLIPSNPSPIKGKISPRKVLQSKLSFKLHYKRYHLPGELENELKARYVESNRDLQQRYNLNLPDIYF